MMRQKCDCGVNGDGDVDQRRKETRTKKLAVNEADRRRNFGFGKREEIRVYNLSELYSFLTSSI
jgi:hypothetical protein